MRVDLHTHSTASDGTQTPAEVMASAADAGLDVVALTDHDTAHGWPEAARAAAGHGLALVRGIEISCSLGGRSIHLLAYLADPDDPSLAVELGHAREARVGRLRRMAELMAADGIPVTYEQVLAQVPEGATEGRPHIADALVASGTVATRDEAFVRWLGNDSPYYVRHYAPHPVRAVELVVAAGGVPVFAHPFGRGRGTGADDRVVEEMWASGLAGLEVHHRDHDEAAVQRGLALASRFGLLVTGSSDYHGAGKDNRLGEHTTDPDVLAEIESRASGVVPVLR